MTTLDQILEATNGQLTDWYEVVDGQVFDAVTGEVVEITETCKCDEGHICLSLKCQSEFAREMERYEAAFTQGARLSKDEARDVYSDPSDTHKLAEFS